MAEEKVNQNTGKVSTTATHDNDNASSEATKEYILLDNVLYLPKPSGRGSKKYKKGNRVPLTEAVATTLLAEPRPSVREVTKDDNKDDNEDS